MQKRIRIVSFSIVLVILLIGIIVINNNSNNKYSFTQDGIKYALTLDGNKITSFPSKGMYKVQVICVGADGRWLYDEWKLAIENITSDDVTCDIKFETISKINLNDYIISLLESEQGTGKVVNENGYRYEGKNPNNYIWFNNEYWRIIGVFDSASHGQSGKNLVKIIRADVLDGLAWHKSNTNDWTTASLNLLLNGAYYNAHDGTSSGYCYVYNGILANCDYTIRGIQSGYRGMIANVTWYLGGYSDYYATAEAFYGYERGTTVYSGRPTSTTGYIGLMYPSDYGYSVLSSSCARTTELRSYNTPTCAGQSWLYGKGHEWTLTPYSTNSASVFYLGYRGPLYYEFAHYGIGSRPVLYLDASVYKTDGDGSLENPYIVGM
ncbi:MAG: hypothetical protein KIC90_05135 [Firmicutes bacterium]|nr:hypothetical protein [Bacillota bacterium]